MSSTAQSRSCEVRNLPVLRVARRGDRHHIHDLALDISLQLDAGADAWPGVPDVIRAAHALAAEHAAGEPEHYALEVARFCVRRLPAVTSARVDVRLRGWQRLTIGGRPREQDLLDPAAEQRVARADAGSSERISAGIRDLLLLSSHAPADARVTLVRLEALWEYGWREVPYQTQWQQVRRALTEAYAERDAAVAGALALHLARAALDESPAVSRIRISAETVERPAVDMNEFGLENAGEVFGAPAAARHMHEVTLTRTELSGAGG